MYAPDWDCVCQGDDMNDIFKKYKFGIMVIALIILGAVSLSLGKYPISYNDIYEIMSVRFFGSELYS